MITDEYELMCEIGSVYEAWNRNELKEERWAIQLIKNLIELHEIKKDE